VDQWISFYAPNAVALPPNEPIADTPAKIKKSMAGFLSLPDLSLSFWSDKVRVARSKDVAYEYGHYRMSFKDGKGNTVKDEGKYAEVWCKQRAAGGCAHWICSTAIYRQVRDRLLR
jgi:ketosteroid isomerase-like protein